MYLIQSSLLLPGSRTGSGWILPLSKSISHVIEVKMIAGNNVGSKVLIPWMALTPSDVTKFPIRFQRWQFPITVCYAMTINKSQGQSLAHVGLYLHSPMSSHGQLYVAFSRVTGKKGLKVLILDEEGKPTDTTTNMVCKELCVTCKLAYTSVCLIHHVFFPMDITTLSIVLNFYMKCELCVHFYF